MIKRLSFTVLLVFVLILMGACHEGTFHWITPEAPPVTVDEPDVVPAEEVGEVLPDPTPEPPCTIIKGNISRDGRKLYFEEGDRNFNQVKIDEAKGEKFFCSIEAAEAEGWVHAGNQ